ncbi:MAG: hypothetical protein ACRC2R_18065 [Xenococcaceae cyanobacterium]
MTSTLCDRRYLKMFKMRSHIINDVLVRRSHVTDIRSIFSAAIARRRTLCDRFTRECEF